MQNSAQVLKLPSTVTPELLQKQFIADAFHHWTEHNPPIHVVPLRDWVSDFVLWFLREAQNEESFLHSVPNFPSRSHF